MPPNNGLLLACAAPRSALRSARQQMPRPFGGLGVPGRSTSSCPSARRSRRPLLYTVALHRPDRRDSREFVCCFSKPVYSVSSTNIFAREAPDGRQYLAYSMTVSAPDDLAMLLPLPVPRGCAEDAVDFIDLSEYPELFDDLVQGFPNENQDVWHWAGRPGQTGALTKLPVLDVGCYEASFVPSARDLQRLDSRFRLPVELLEQLPGCDFSGFAVFKLRPGNQRVHPMAFVFPRANQGTLFFPTVHIHDGEVHPMARFDHSLFCQRGSGAHRSGWPGTEWRHSDAARGFVNIEKARGLVDGARHVYRRRILGRAPNRDIYVDS